MYRYTRELRELFPRPQRVQLSLVAGVALTDFTESNGATVIFPGSHEWQEDPGEVVPVPLVDPAPSGWFGWLPALHSSPGLRTKPSLLSVEL